MQVIETRTDVRAAPRIVSCWLTQAQLAAALGIDRTTIYRMERRGHFPAGSVRRMHGCHVRYHLPTLERAGWLRGAP